MGCNNQQKLLGAKLILLYIYVCVRIYDIYTYYKYIYICIHAHTHIQNTVLKSRALFNFIILIMFQNQS